jgi:DNA-binding NtrC family response regulator
MKDGIKDAVKDQTNTEITDAADTQSAGRVWIAPALTQSMAPLLAGLGLELLEAGDRERATVRVELAATDADFSAGRLRVERVGGAAHGKGRRDLRDARNPDSRDPDEAIEFEGAGVWAAASFVVSQSFGLSPPLLTADPAMFAVIRAAARAGQVDSPILVTGETGTGKELLVHLIHAASRRAGGLVSVNCPALNGTILANPLREVEGEAPAREAPSDEGRLDELCATAGATLFLDQVSELSRATQTRVLHAILQAGDAQAADSAGQPRTGARLVSATNRALAPMLLGGEFKRELYDRLAVLTLTVPPLRERRADVAMLAEGFLRVAAPRLRFSPGALKALANYSFPGNVRELHNLVTRFAIMQRDVANHLIHATDVRPELAGPPPGPSIWKSSPFRMRREMALQALMVCGGDRAAAARKLGISVRALQQHVASVAGPVAPRAR